MKPTSYKLIGTVLLMVGFATTAHAASITGGINIGALSTVSLDKVNNTVAFTPDASQVNAIVSSSTGSLAVLAPAFTLGSYKDFNYSPLSVANPIWTFGGVSFDLTQVTFINELGPGLVLGGTGILKAGGYDDTLGSWSFSADTSGGSFSWSSTATAQVPDGGTSMSLFGLSLLGLAGVAKKLRRK
jgi:hypothetical protein